MIHIKEQWLRDWTSPSELGFDSYSHPYQHLEKHSHRTAPVHQIIAALHSGALSTGRCTTVKGFSFITD